MDLTPDNWISIISIGIGLLIAIVSLLVSWWLNKQTLEQAEKHIRMQLTYEDEKAALQHLDSMISHFQIDRDKMTVANMVQAIEQFFSSMEGQYVPMKIKKLVWIKLTYMASLEFSQYPPSISDTKLTIGTEPLESTLEEQSFDQIYEKQMARKFADLITSMKKETNAHLKKKINTQ